MKLKNVKEPAEKLASMSPGLPAWQDVQILDYHPEFFNMARMQMDNSLCPQFDRSPINTFLILSLEQLKGNFFKNLLFFVPCNYITKLTSISGNFLNDFAVF